MRMIDEMMQAIGTALAAEFGSQYMVYMEEKKQDLKKPCFFISCAASSCGQFLNNRNLWINQFCIEYVPETDALGETGGAVIKRLFLCLKHLEVYGKQVRGTKMKYETKDGVFSFFVNYDVFVQRGTDTEPVMEELREKIFVKGQV